MKTNTRDIGNFVQREQESLPLLFCGVNYHFWKVHIKIFMGSINKGICQAVVNGYTIPTQEVNNETIKKPYESWSTEETKRAKYDSKATNIMKKMMVLSKPRGEGGELVFKTK